MCRGLSCKGFACVFPMKLMRILPVKLSICKKCPSITACLFFIISETDRPKVSGAPHLCSLRVCKAFLQAAV